MNYLWKTVENFVENGKLDRDKGLRYIKAISNFLISTNILTIKFNHLTAAT